jgi:hypothetical protein
VSDTIVPGVEEGFDHVPRPSDAGLAVAAYCSTCGVLVVRGPGGWQHAEETP